MNLIFENYNMFLNENNEMFSSTKNVQRLLTDDGQFRAFVESLVDGVDASVRPAIVNVLNRQRYSILSEAATGANFATGWTVSSFPILTDIYAEPIISELANIYPTDKPMISIPRIKIKATTTGYDGTTVSTKYMPTATSLIRVGEETVQVQPGMSVNIFNALGDIDSNKFKMNRRYTLATVIDVTETKADGTTTVNHSIPVSIRPDNRNQLIGEFSFVDTPASGTGVTVNCTLNGNVNFESGIIILNVVFGAGTASHTFECNFVSFKLRFTPVGTLAGRTKVSVEQTNTDVTIDPKLLHWGH